MTVTRGWNEQARKGVGFQNSAIGPDLVFYATHSYSLMRPPRRGALDPPLGEVGGWVVGPRWAELAAAMRAPSVVMGFVLGQDHSEMPFTEGQHPVGDLGPGSEHESFRVSVRPRTPRRDLHHLDPGASRHRVERGGELAPVPVSALTLFPRGFDQVIPQVLAVFLFYLPLVFPVGTTRPGRLFGR